MKNLIKTPLRGLIVIAIILLGYYSFTNNFMGAAIMFFCIYSLAAVYHLIVDQGGSKLFLVVISFFILAEVVFSLSHFGITMGNSNVAISYFLFLGGLIPIFNKVMRLEKKLLLNQYSWIIGLTLALNAFIVYLILNMMMQFKMGWEHIFLGLGQTLLTLLLLSVGLVLYALTVNKSRRFVLLYWTLACIFLAEAIDVINYTLYITDPVTAFNLLSNGLYVVGLFAFYLYCTSRSILMDGNSASAPDFLQA